ncbi:protein kinase a catalytic subunit, putative [Ichthyophthirius multifiliis]|uniref:Protein kinase a catalytic subunit, putative n=1 Tax=Ichthyophthirius multifiliis TaxID=5932 RepID=G0R074_ICHMU|nr:protein kinase a catalytic subunit, putative [Ichthyophthirius multifiliis]EGR29134.1 protein kinase a catalytic subunit, putative [Ichthyophthirius multifiliis]|eukprot:XP_004030370.1 protein kinase a catalytic subunit, putative [Ichthyophthirius multifiliis]
MEVMYRDIKPENILINNLGHIKLIDFGLSKKMNAQDKTYSFAGTPEYLAPEVILNKGHGKSVDLWAIGVLFYEMISGKTPFCDDSKNFEKIQRFYSLYTY